MISLGRGVGELGTCGAWLAKGKKDFFAKSERLVDSNIPHVPQNARDDSERLSLSVVVVADNRLGLAETPYYQTKFDWYLAGGLLRPVHALARDYNPKVSRGCGLRDVVAMYAGVGCSIQLEFGGPLCPGGASVLRAISGPNWRGPKSTLICPSGDCPQVPSRNRSWCS